MSVHGKAEVQTDLYVASCNIRRARHEHAMARKAYAPYAKVKFNGGRSEPLWDARRKAQRRLISAEYTRKNLEKLVRLDDSGMCRRLGFNRYEDLVVDGNWICILDGGTDEVCIPCARRLLLEGDLDPENVHAYLLYVDQPECETLCSECGIVLWHVEDEEDEECLEESQVGI